MKKQLLTKALLGAALVVTGGNGMQAQSLNFGSNLEESLAVGQSHRTIPMFCDFNNDGIMDIYYGGRGYTEELGWHNPSRVALNKGNNEWDLVEQDFNTSWGYGSKAIDFNQDGLVDFLFLTGAEGDVNDGFGLRLIRNEGNGKLSLVEDECLASLNLTHENDNHKNNRSNPWQSLSIGDYDKDGYPDILIMGSAADGSRVMKLLHNKAGQGFEATDFSLSMDHGTVWLADFTGDGWVDIFATGWCDGDGMSWVSLLFENKHDGTFENISEYAFGSNTAYGFEGSGENAVQVLDYNQDGNLDIFLMGSLRNFDKNWSEKTAFILKNDGTGKFSEEVTNIMAISGAAERLNFMADFNGDGYVDYVGYGWGAGTGSWTWSINSSTGLDQYTHNLGDPGIYLSEGNMAIGDWNNDGLLDFVLGNAWTDYGSQLVFSSNKTEGTTVLKPTAPTGVKATYDAATKALNVTWENGTMSSGSKPFYNLYLKNKETDKTFTIAPANLELGTQSAYTEFSVYVQGTSYTFENVEAGNYEVGVQSVTYSWQASTFATATPELSIDETTVPELTANMTYGTINMARTLKANKWNTFCAPYNISAEEIANNGLGEVKVLESATVNGDNVILNFVSATSIEAGKPYIVKPESEVNTITTSNSTIAATTASEIKLASEGITMTGTFAPMSLNNNEYFISDNTFYYADQAINVNGFRAYISVEDTSSVAGVNRMLINIDGITTGIETIDTAEETTDVYTLSGIRVKKDVKVSEALNGLAKGIYVVNGKKVIK